MIKYFILVVFMGLYSSLSGQTDSIKAIQIDEAVVNAHSKTAVSIRGSDNLRLQVNQLFAIPSLMGSTDLLRLIQLMPGVQNSGEANGYLYIRGSDPGHSAILYNGASVFGLSHLFGIFPLYSSDHIENIDFNKSGIDVAHGGFLGASVNAQTNWELPKQASIQGNVGLLASQLSVTLPIGKKLGFKLSGRQTYIDQILTPLLNSSSKNKNKDVDDIKYNLTDVYLTLIYQPNKTNKITLDGFLSTDRFKIKDQALLLDGQINWQNQVVSSTWEWQLTPTTQWLNTWSFSAYQNQLGVKQASISMDVESEVQELKYNSRFVYQLFNTTFESGFQYSHYQIQPQNVKTSDLGLDLLGANGASTHANNLVLYSKTKLRLSKRLHSELGIRLSYYKTVSDPTKYWHIEPRATLHYYFDNNWLVFANYARKHQYLSFITTSSVGFPTDFWLAASVDVPAQTADEVSVGVKRKFSQQFDFSFSSFYRSMNDLSEYPFNLLQFNEMQSYKADLFTGKGHAYGAEWMLKYHHNKLNAWLSYTLSWSFRKFDKLNEGKEFPAKFDRRHNLSLAASYNLNQKWSFGLTQLLASGSRFTVPTSWYFINNNPVKEYGDYNAASMPNYVRTDISVNYFLKKTTKIESCLVFSIYNCFAIRNPIYSILDINSNADGTQIKVETTNKSLYTILPSLSWRFKF